MQGRMVPLLAALDSKTGVTISVHQPQRQTSLDDLKSKTVDGGAGVEVLLVGLPGIAREQ